MPTDSLTIVKMIFAYAFIVLFVLLISILIVSVIRNRIRSNKKRKEEERIKKINDSVYDRLLHQPPSTVNVRITMAPDGRIVLYKGTICIGTLMVIRDVEKHKGNPVKCLSIFKDCNQCASVDTRIGLDIPFDSGILNKKKVSSSGIIYFELCFVLCTENQVFRVIEDNSIKNCIILSVNRMTGTMNMIAKDDEKIVDTLLIDKCYVREKKDMFIYYLLTMKDFYRDGDITTGMSNVESTIYGFSYDYLTIGCNFNPNYIAPDYDYDY